VFALGPALETEVLEEFVGAELRSPRFCHRITDAIARFGNDPRPILAETRGYPDRYLFVGFPRDVTWSRVLLAPADAASVLLYPADEWREYTKGTRDPKFLVEALGSPNFPDPDFAERTRTISTFYQNRQHLPWIILASDGKSLSCLEGNSRLTAYLFAGAKYMLPAYLGQSSSMKEWAFF
jgi:hypothetical protein